MKTLHLSHRSRITRCARSFTLIEILVVISILIVLVAILLPVVNKARTKAKYTRWRGFAHQMRSDDRLLVYYTFEDGFGSTNVANQAVGSGLPWLYSTAPNDATLTGGLKITPADGRWPGLKGGVRFTGNSSRILTAPDFVWHHDGIMAITVLMWVKIETTDVAGATFFTIGNANQPNICQAHVPWSDQRLYWDHGSLADGRICMTFTPNLNKWTHIALVSAGIGGNSKAIYINGKQAAYVCGSPNVSNGPVSPRAGIFIGGGPIWNQYSKGRIDEFAAYARVLSPSEIEKHYRSGKP